MASKCEAVLAAVKSLVAAALPGTEVKRNLAKAERIPPGGLVVIRQIFETRIGRSGRTGDQPLTTDLPLFAPHPA